MADLGVVRLVRRLTAESHETRVEQFLMPSILFRRIKCLIDSHCVLVYVRSHDDFSEPPP